MWQILVGVMVCLSALACVRQPIFVTSINHFDQRDQFRHCDIWLGVEGKTLLAQCGDPHHILKTTGTDEICVAYENRGQSMRANNPHAPIIAVCIAPEFNDGGLGAKERAKERRAQWNNKGVFEKIGAGTVVGVYGLSGMPDVETAPPEEAPVKEFETPPKPGPTPEQDPQLVID